MTLRTAVVGAGIVSENNHLPAVSRNPRTELVAVCDVDEGAVREAVAEYGGRAYTDAEAMLDGERLDWVHVATPVQTHFELASAAVEAGVPATVQKPATTTREELDDLRALAEERGVPVSVVHNWLFYPVVRDLRRRIAAGEFGEIRAVETTFSGEGRPDDTYRGDWVYDLPGGDLEEGIAHPLYLTLDLGGPPRDEDAVDVQTRTVRQYEAVGESDRADDSDRIDESDEVSACGDLDSDHGGFDYDGVSLQWTTDEDALCSVTVLSGSAPNDEIRVYGTDASARVDVQTNTVEVHDADEGPFHVLAEQLARSVSTAESVVSGAFESVRAEVADRVEEELDYHREASADGHYYLLNEAAKALERGRQPPVPLAHSHWVLTLLEQVRDDASGQSHTAGERSKSAEGVTARDDSGLRVREEGNGDEQEAADAERR